MSRDHLINGYAALARIMPADVQSRGGPLVAAVVEARDALDGLREERDAARALFDELRDLLGHITADDDEDECLSPHHQVRLQAKTRGGKP